MAYTEDFDRLRRQAINVHPAGPAIVDRLLEESSGDEMVASAMRGMPPAMAVSGLLQPELRPALADDRLRRFMGTVCAAVMMQRGWRVKRKGVRIPGNSPFSTASVFERIPAQPTAEFCGEVLLSAMLAGLSADQRSALVVRLQEMNA